MRQLFTIGVAALLACTALTTNAQTVPSYVPTNGLVGWWPFNGNANDESGNGNNGVVNGTTLTTDRNGNPSSAYAFNGTTSEISVTNTFLPLNSDYTISCWMSSSDINKVQQCLFNSINHTGFVVELNNENLPPNKLMYGVGPSNAFWNLIYAQGFYNQFQNSIWYHVVFRKTGANYNLFVDGNIDGTSTVSASSNYTQNVGIRFGSIGGSEFFKGKLDDFGIWNRALTQQEITALYQSNTCSVPAYVPTNGLVGYWPFCGNANDVSGSGNGNNGTVNGATLTTDRNGTLNEAFEFDGISDFISIGSLNNISNFSIAFWFKRNNDLNLSYPIGLGINNANTVDVYKGYGIGIAPNSASACGIAANDIKANDGLSTCANIVGNSTSILNTWEHIVLTSNGSSASLFYNGTLSQFNNSIFIPGILDLVVGMRSDNFAPFPGSIDDIGVWNRVLSPLEIQQLYNSTLCTKPEPVTLGTGRSTKLCPNEAVTIEIVTPSTAGLSYEWTRNGTTIPGATASSITVSDAAKYKVFVRSGPGLNCQRVSGLIETTAAIPPTITATTPNGNAYCPGDSVLMSATGATAGYSYQWKRFGVPIAGATSATFYAKQTGNYRCEVTNAGGCINQSNLITVTSGTSCRMMNDASGDIIVYPNPARNEFTLKFGDIGEEQPVLAELRDHQGRLVSKIPLHSKGAVNFDTDKLATGYYTVKVFFESGDAMEKQVSVVK